MSYGEMRFSEKLDSWIRKRGRTQGAVAKEAGLSPSAISDMTAAKRRPYLDQGLKLARALEIPLDYLADDAQDEPAAAGPGLTADEERALWLIRELGLTAGEVLRRLAGEPGGRASGEARLLRVRDLEAEARRLGPEPGEQGRAVAEGQDDRPRPGDGL